LTASTTSSSLSTTSSSLSLLALGWVSMATKRLENEWHPFPVVCQCRGRQQGGECRGRTCASGKRHTTANTHMHHCGPKRPRVHRPILQRAPRTARGSLHSPPVGPILVVLTHTTWTSPMAGSSRRSSSSPSNHPHSP
jgi:hypothetical protein